MPPVDPCPDHLGGLSLEHWQGLRQQQSRLDHRASSTTALLAYAAAGVLPSAQPLLRSRSEQARLRPPSPLPPASVKLTCAVCRIATHEIALAAAVARRCLAPPVAAALLASVPAVLCEHLGALGYLGHTEWRVAQLQPICDAAVAADGGARCDAACGTDGGGGGGGGGRFAPSGELPGWPALLQALLDGEGAPLSPALRSGGAAARLLTTPRQSARVTGGAAEARGVTGAAEAVAVAGAEAGSAAAAAAAAAASAAASVALPAVHGAPAAAADGSEPATAPDGSLAGCAGIPAGGVAVGAAACALAAAPSTPPAAAPGAKPCGPSAADRAAASAASAATIAFAAAGTAASTPTASTAAANGSTAAAGCGAWRWSRADCARCRSSRRPAALCRKTIRQTHIRKAPSLRYSAARDACDP